MPDITKLIESDHREVEQLFGRFKASRDRQIALEICTELDRHAGAEEKVFYPVVRDDVPGGAGLAEEGEEEHAEVRQLIGRIKNTTDPEHLDELMAELEQNVQHHVDEEESETLPKTRETLDPGRLSELGRDFEAAKDS
jgi:hemerythrin superfamily protein